MAVDELPAQGAVLDLPVFAADKGRVVGTGQAAVTIEGHGAVGITGADHGFS